MPKYLIHVGVRFTSDWQIEAESEDEALEIAERAIDEIESPAGFEFASDDYDVLEVRCGV